jgi:hypothetical protein
MLAAKRQTPNGVLRMASPGRPCSQAGAVVGAPHASRQLGVQLAVRRRLFQSLQPGQ